LNPKIEKLLPKTISGHGRWCTRPADPFRELAKIMDASIDHCLGEAGFSVRHHYWAMVDLTHREGLHEPVPSESTFRRAVKKERRRRLAAEAASSSTVTHERLPCPGVHLRRLDGWAVEPGL